MNIKLLQFTNGDVIIGEYNYDVVKNPFLLTYHVHKEEDGPVLSMVPYALFAVNHSINVNPSNVIWKADPNLYMIEDYRVAVDRVHNPPSETTE